MDNSILKPKSKIDIERAIEQKRKESEEEIKRIKKETNFSGLNIKHILFKVIIKLSWKFIHLLEGLVEYLREKKCKHPKTFIGTYSWAPGHNINGSTICSICHKLVDSPYSMKNMVASLKMYREKN